MHKILANSLLFFFLAVILNPHLHICVQMISFFSLSVNWNFFSTFIRDIVLDSSRRGPRTPPETFCFHVKDRAAPTG